MVTYDGGMRVRSTVLAVAGAVAAAMACTSFLDLRPLEVIGDDASAPEAGDAGTPCACRAGSACVEGVCQPCTATWKATGVTGVALAHDAKRNMVFAAAPVGGGESIVTLNACTGERIPTRPPATSKVGIDPVPALHELVSSGDVLYSRASCTIGASPADTCIYRYDIPTNSFDARGSIAVTHPQDVVWNLAVTGSGRVFASGTFGGVYVPRIAALERDGTNCGGQAVDAGSAAYAVGASGDDVHQVIDTGVAGQIVLARYSGPACKTSGSPCSCAPVSLSPPLTLPAPAAPSEPRTYSLLVRGNLVYVVGVYPVAAGGVSGFVVAYDVGATKWSPVFVYAPSGAGKTDGLLYATITPDEKLLYVVGAKDAFTAGSTGVVLRFDLPLPFDTTPKVNGEITVPGASIVWQVAVPSDAVFVAAVAASGSFVAKCTSGLSCPK